MPPYLEILRSVSDNSIQSSFHGAIPHELLYDVVCWCDCEHCPPSPLGKLKEGTLQRKMP